MMKMFSRSMMLAASGKTVPSESRARMIGVLVFLIASEMATVVMEFLDMSPAKMEKSPFSMIFSRSLSFAKEPESVEAVMMMFESVGTLFLKESGKMTLVREIGKWLLMNSAILIGATNDWELPPIILTVPVFCSGMFQDKFSKSGFSSCFCQKLSFSIKIHFY